MIRNWIRIQIIKCINWLEDLEEELTITTINNIRYIIVNTQHKEDSLNLIKKYLDRIVKLQGLSKYKAFQYVFDRLEIQITEAEIKEYRVSLKDWFNS